MKVGIAGAGKVGCSLAIGFYRKGIEISAIYFRNPPECPFDEEGLNQRITQDLGHTIEKSDVVFITVPDSSIGAAAVKIVSETVNENIRGRAFFHCSGAFTSDILGVLKEAGGITGSLHPLQSFADRMNGWKGLEGICFAFEGDKEAEAVARQVSALFNGTFLEIGTESKPLYHAAACMISNYTVALAYKAAYYLQSIGMNEKEAEKALLPLLEGTVDNIRRLGSVQALTGPVSRGDAETVLGHLTALEKKLPMETGLYKALGYATVDVALKKGCVSDEKAEHLHKIFK